MAIQHQNYYNFVLDNFFLQALYFLDRAHSNLRSPLQHFEKKCRIFQGVGAEGADCTPLIKSGPLIAIEIPYKKFLLQQCGPLKPFCSLRFLLLSAQISSKGTILINLHL